MAAQSPSLEPPRDRASEPGLGFDFRQLRIAIVHPPDRDGQTLIRHLQRLRCEITPVWPAPAKIDTADIAFCLLQSDTYPLCSELMRARTIGLVAIVDPSLPQVLQILAALGPHAAMTRPFDPVAILTNVIIASTNSRYQKRLSNKIAKLEETLRSIRMVERAKVVLMKARNIEEPEAYAYLRDQAMRKRTSVGSIASVIVESGNILLGSRDEF
jgi:AmiR/NasT family two-component response regulator